MYKRELPEGVPSDNLSASFGAKDDRAGLRQGYDAPDMATPQFTQSSPAPTLSVRKSADAGTADDGYLEQTPGASKPAPRAKSRKGQNPSGANIKMMMLMSLVAAIAVAGILAVSSLRPGAPLCSSLPDWNQYNCRAG